MKLLVIAGLVLCAIAIAAVVRSRMKRKSPKNNVTLLSRNEKVTLRPLPSDSTPAPTSAVVPDDDRDDDKYWRRYYR